MTKSFLGIDIGAASAKAVIIREGDMVARAVMETGPSVERVADILLKQVLGASGLSSADLNGGCRHRLRENSGPLRG